MGRKIRIPGKIRPSTKKKIKLTFKHNNNLKGNQATVYKIRHKKSDNLFAAKVYLTTDSEKISLVFNFKINCKKNVILKIEREVSILQHICHPNVIQTYELLKDESMGIYAIVLEYFPSLPLSTMIEEQRLNLEEQTKICVQIFESLMFLHENSIAHRDLNSDNVLVNQQTCNVKIIDFGLSMKIRDSFEVESPEGNMLYRPPALEVFQDLYSADIWNAGLIFLSVFLKRNITTKAALILLKNKIIKKIGESFEMKILTVLRQLFKENGKEGRMDTFDFFSSSSCI